jgi:hypothetical protein
MYLVGGIIYNLNPWVHGGAVRNLLIPQRLKISDIKCPLNLWVTLRHFNSTEKPTSYTLNPP